MVSEFRFLLFPILELNADVCGYCSLGELVQHGQNGLVFDSAQQLASQLEVHLPVPFCLTSHPFVCALQSLFNTTGDGSSSGGSKSRSRSSSSGGEPRDVSLQQLREGVAESQHIKGHWDAAWRRVALPLFQ